MQLITGRYYPGAMSGWPGGVLGRAELPFTWPTSTTGRYTASILLWPGEF